MHLTSSPIDWYAARAVGFTAYLILSGVVLLGITMAAKKRSVLWPRFAIEDVHRFGGLLLGALISIHVMTIAIDSWLPFSIQSLVVPFTARYRPLWTGLGVAAAELLLALAITNHYRQRMRYAYWRRAHYLNFAVWAAATAHGVGSGTDRSAWWALGTYGVAVFAVAAAIMWRAASDRSWKLPGAVAAGLAAALLVIGMATGPLRFEPKPWNATDLNEKLTGHVSVITGFTYSIVSSAGQGQGRQRVVVRADVLFSLHKQVSTSFQMEYLPSGELCKGTVTSLHPTGYNPYQSDAGLAGYAARCRLRTGAWRGVDVRWRPHHIVRALFQLKDATVSAHPIGAPDRRQVATAPG